jgi:hypothetical protein
MSLEVIAIGSDNLVRLDSLQNATTLAYINSATVNFTLLDANGNPVVSNVPMSYVGGSNGRYEGSITNAVSSGLTPSAAYTIQITGTYQGVQIFRKLSCIALYRSNQ